MTDAGALLTQARKFRFVREAPGNHNGGRWVEAMQRIGGTVKGQPWCLCYVFTVLGIEFAGDPPLTYTASCDLALAEARKKGLVVTTPAPGDLFFVMKSPTDATHVGIVTDIGATTFGSIEGNASDPEHAPTREGWGVFERTPDHPKARALNGHHVFVRVLP